MAAAAVHDRVLQANASANEAAAAVYSEIGWPPLQDRVLQAAMSGDAEALKVFSKDEVNIAVAGGYTALMWAASPKKVNGKVPPLDKAQPAAIKALVKAGADVNAKDNQVRCRLCSHVRSRGLLPP